MLLAIPVSQSDVHLLDKRVDLIKKLGPYPRHVLAIVPDITVEQPAKEALEKLSPLFSRAELLRVNLNGITGWPLASNKHFKLAAQAIHALGIREAFYFFELDNTPLCSGWLDRLHDEYVSANKPYMGCVVPTRGFQDTPQGRVPILGEPHMVGTGIYPPNYAAYSPKIQHIDRVAAFTGMPLEPFDVAIRHEVIPHSHSTNLIQHLWRTCNFRKEGKQIVCDDMPGVGPNESHKAPVSSSAVVVHGCKDDSLPNLLLSAADPIVSPTTDGAVAGASAADSCASPVAGDQSSDGLPKHKTFIGTQVGKLVADKPMRIKELAKLLKLELDQLKAEIDNPVNGLVLSNKAGWVKLA